ncbi:MAG: hypothetical protein Q8P81_03230 [Nanoarchaeota archaeon]|nr:hypothetical protein [Nanoarchaeota archaeon]
MSKKSKQLLNESTIRKFMKLANLKPLSENFLDSLREDEEEDPEMGAGPEMPSDMPPEMDSEPAVGDEQMVKDIVSAVAAAIQDVTGVEVEVEGGTDEEGEEGEEMPQEPGMDMEPEIEEKPEEDIMEDTLPSGDRSQQSGDQRELPAHDQVVEGEEIKKESKEFGGTKDAKMKDAQKPKKDKVEESKKKLTKEQMIKMISERVAKRIIESKKKGKK